jgi:cold shock protein
MSVNTELDGIILSKQRVLGRVKWFNNKSGYGFITLMEENMTDLDVFVHHSSIHIEGEHYKYLVQGEYVSFNIELANNGGHKYHTTFVRGVRDGKLMCETKNDIKYSRVGYTESRDEDVNRTPTDWELQHIKANRHGKKNLTISVDSESM